MSKFNVEPVKCGPEGARRGKAKRPEAKRATVVIPVTLAPMQGFGGGFRQDWISGEAKGIRVGLETGAGLGNPLLTVWIQRPDDNREYFTANMRTFLQAAANALLTEPQAERPLREVRKLARGRAGG